MPKRIGLALAAAVWLSPVHAANPDALWQIVHERCVPDETANHNPAPCSLVDLSEGERRGYIVMKDRVGPAQFLLIPTDKIPGIESPSLLSPDSPNYFAAAWKARRFFLDKLAKPLTRDAISLAINSALARSQNQLHIHIDCLRPDIRQTLRDHEGEIGASWAPLSFPLAGHSYRARRLDQPELDGEDPIKLLAEADPVAKADMGKESLAVVGAHFASGDGFILLEIRANLADGNPAHSEELQDHECRVASDAP